MANIILLIIIVELFILLKRVNFLIIVNFIITSIQNVIVFIRQQENSDCCLYVCQTIQMTEARIERVHTILTKSIHTHKLANVHNNTRQKQQI